MQLTRTLIAFLCFSTAFAVTSNASLLRRRELSDFIVTNKKIPCASLDNGVCKCPGPCMDGYKNGTCILKTCYSWDEDLATCKETGPEFTPAIVLQAIPFTGVFGSGFGNMGRWDLFGIGSGIWGGGIVLACLFACACSAGENASAEGTSLCMSCWGCVWALGIAAYWIWGIVVIANKTVYGPNGCPLH